MHSKDRFLEGNDYGNEEHEVGATHRKELLLALSIIKDVPMLDAKRTPTIKLAMSVCLLHNWGLRGA